GWWLDGGGGGGSAFRGGLRVRWPRRVCTAGADGALGAPSVQRRRPACTGGANPGRIPPSAHYEITGRTLDAVHAQSTAGPDRAVQPRGLITRFNRGA